MARWPRRAPKPRKTRSNEACVRRALDAALSGHRIATGKVAHLPGELHQEHPSLRLQNHPEISALLLGSWGYTKEPRPGQAQTISQHQISTGMSA
jgi:hypothetical protein